MSPRSLGALERGGSMPDREIVLTLADRLDVPLRERNAMLGVAGFAPLHPVGLLGDTVLGATVGSVLGGHAPNPAFAIDRHWCLVASNAALGWLIGGVDPTLLHPPVNMLRLMLHPAGLAPRIANLRDWRQHLMDRLRSCCEAASDSVLADLMEEVRDYPVPPDCPDDGLVPAVAGVAVPLRLVTVDGTLAFFGTTTLFGAAIDVTLAELTIETLYPADDATAEIIRLAAARPAATG